MKVVMVRSNSIDPDVRLEKEAPILFDNSHDILQSGWDRFGDCPSHEQKNGNSIRRIQCKAPPEYFVRDNYCAMDWCNRTHFEALKN